MTHDCMLCVYVICQSKHTHWYRLDCPFILFHLSMLLYICDDLNMCVYVVANLLYTTTNMMLLLACPVKFCCSHRKFNMVIYDGVVKCEPCWWFAIYVESMMLYSTMISMICCFPPVLICYYANAGCSSVTWAILIFCMMHTTHLYGSVFGPVQPAA